MKSSVDDVDPTWTAIGLATNFDEKRKIFQAESVVRLE